MSIKVQPCKNNIGAEISCSLKTASKEEINQIKEALNGFGVVFFRNQNLDSESYIKFAKNFGPLADYPMLKGLSKEFPEITVVERKVNWMRSLLNMIMKMGVNTENYS